jgi:predicted Zn-ribbon and HTH transcriptional regulator
MRIRCCCVGSDENEREMIEEIYWINGLTFYLIENGSSKIKTLVELEFVENNENLIGILMRMNIKSNLLEIESFYNSLNDTIQEFIKEWIVPEFYERIQIVMTKRRKNLKVDKSQSPFRLSQSLLLSNNNKLRFSNSILDLEKFKCFHCGFTNSMSEVKENPTCDKCKIIFYNFFIFSFFKGASHNIFLENKLALKKIVGQGKKKNFF